MRSLYAFFSTTLLKLKNILINKIGIITFGHNYIAQAESRVSGILSKLVIIFQNLNIIVISLLFIFLVKSTHVTMFNYNKSPSHLGINYVDFDFLNEILHTSWFWILVIHFVLWRIFFNRIGAILFDWISDLIFIGILGSVIGLLYFQHEMPSYLIKTIQPLGSLLNLPLNYSTELIDFTRYGRWLGEFMSVAESVGFYSDLTDMSDFIEYLIAEDGDTLNTFNVSVLNLNKTSVFLDRLCLFFIVWKITFAYIPGYIIYYSGLFSQQYLDSIHNHYYALNRILKNYISWIFVLIAILLLLFPSFRIIWNLICFNDRFYDTIIYSKHLSLKVHLFYSIQHNYNFFFYPLCDTKPYWILLDTQQYNEFKFKLQGFKWEINSWSGCGVEVLLLYSTVFLTVYFINNYIFFYILIISSNLLAPFKEYSVWVDDFENFYVQNDLNFEEADKELYNLLKKYYADYEKQVTEYHLNTKTDLNPKFKIKVFFPPRKSWWKNLK